jgi:hypothetical protein
MTEDVEMTDAEAEADEAEVEGALAAGVLYLSIYR